jgi:hypothetical protein
VVEAHLVRRRECLAMRTPKVIRVVVQWLDRATCWHRSEMLHREDGVLSVRCEDCGYESPGLDTKARWVPK